MILLFTPEFAVLYLNPFDIDQNATNCPTYLNVKFLSLNYFQPVFLLGSEKMFITANGLSVAGAGRGVGVGERVEGQGLRSAAHLHLPGIFPSPRTLVG